MKYILIALLLFSASVPAYQIGGAYAQLVSCNWQQYGNQFGYVGIYNVYGKRYTVFFGSNYCSY